MNNQYEFLLNKKIEELEDIIKELSTMYIYYLKKKDFKSLDNISRQLYRNQYAIDILKEINKWKLKSIIIITKYFL